MSRVTREPSAIPRRPRPGLIVGVQLSPEQAALLDQQVEAHRRQHPGVRFGRADLLRSLWLRSLPGAGQ